MPWLLAVSGSNAALVTFVLYTLVVFGLAAVSNQLLKKKSFLSEYFLGSRSLGVWAFAMTFAATSSSGGSFTGFPSLIYSHGWIMALWIASYMVVPICTMGLLGKRLNQTARLSGAITVPDVVRDRFRSPRLGLLTVMLIVFFMSFNLVAQFKAGSLILKTLLGGVELFQQAALDLGTVTAQLPVLGGANPVDPEYLLCLVGFGVAVILYTTWGGFHAVVWTDVMQGIVMVFGVIIMLPLALHQAGGLESTTREMARMTPPLHGTAAVVRLDAEDGPRSLRAHTWLLDESSPPRLFRLKQQAVFSEGAAAATGVDLLEITTPHEVERIVAGLRERGELVPAVVRDATMTPYASGAGAPGVYVTGPGPSADRAHGYLPLSLAISFFFMWAISGSGQPSNMVRLMAFNSSRTLTRSIFTVAVYYTIIYFPLVIIFCCARVLLPGMETESDRIMPEMAVVLTNNIGAGWLAGVLVAAPFAAVMSTVDSFLLMISSALVRDIYQRNINPAAQDRVIRRLSYLFTMLVGTGALLGALRPADFLQDIIVYTGSGLAACFLAPMVYALYWPRANVPGIAAGMLGGFLAHLSLYVAGVWTTGRFGPYRIPGFEVDPIILGLAVSFAVGFVITLLTPPPPQDLVRKYFHRTS